MTPPARGVHFCGGLAGPRSISYDFSRPGRWEAKAKVVSQSQSWRRNRGSAHRYEVEWTICRVPVRCSITPSLPVYANSSHRPVSKPKPSTLPKAEDPFIPGRRAALGDLLKFGSAWPDVRPLNAWWLPQTLFVPHIDHILTILGLPVESRTAMITAWLPSIIRHKNIVSSVGFGCGSHELRLAGL